MNYLYINWDTYHAQLYDLAQKISTADQKNDLIVAIGRGGLTPGHILSDFLNLPVITFGMISYSDIGKRTEPKIRFPLGQTLQDKRILLVDDVSDSGKTFLAGKEYLRSLGATEIKTCAVYTKPKTIHIPDFWISETAAWIIFPYELRECIEGIATQQRQEGKTKEEITAFLLSLKIPEKYITEFL